GNTIAGDGCSAACVVEAGWNCSATYMPTRCSRCGNGAREWYEQCDDGNTTAGDGCSATCTIESAAWHCNGATPTVCRNCGNGIMEGNEFCDPGIIVTCASRSDLVPPQGGTVTGNIVCDGCTSLVTANNCFKTYTCSAGLPANACWYNCEAVAPFSTTYTYNQTWNGSAWVNADNYLFGFNASPAANSCQFKCRPNYTWNAGTSTCDQNQQRVSCGAKPRSDTYELWNDGESGANIGTYLQTWDGVSGTWQPVLSPHYDAAIGPCHFKCAAGAVWDAGLGQCRICGDNIKEGIEACDTSQFGTSTCQNTVTPPEGSATGGSLSCNLSCGLITTGCTKSWNCVNKPVGTVYYGGGDTYSYGQAWNGSAWVNPNNYLDGYVASPAVNTCQYTCAGAGYVYDGLACSKCGDGVPTGMEPCDDGDLRNDNACKNNCTWNTCRDGYVLTGTEACDDGNAVDTDYCRNNCSWNTCGDGALKATPVNMTHLLPFDGNANDASGKGNNGTLLNGATYVALGGIWGSHGLSLDGIDDRVSIPTTGMSNLQGTIDYWIKPNGWSGGALGAANRHGSFQTIASWSNGARGQMMILDNFEGAFYFRIVDETAASVDVSFANNTYYTSGNWTRVTVTWSRITSRMKVYMNGGFVAETVWNQPIATPFESTAYIGIGHGNPQLGVIDHFRILNRALSDAEITNSMWQSFDGTSAGVDFSHRANNGTLVNGPTVVAGKVGNALSFNGSNQYVTVPDDASQMRLGTAMTVETWVKIAANPGDWVRIVGKSDTDASCSNRNYGLWIASTGQILFQIGGSTGIWGNVMSVRTVTNNVWRHVAGTYDGANMRVYIDGVLEGQLAYTQTPITSAGPLTIGSAVGCHGYLNGQMDETRIYQRALTQAELQNSIEYCDDSNGTNTDACTSACVGSTCGDTIVKSTAPAEVCDSGFLYNGAYGYCKSDCSAMGPRCGDGILTFTTASMVLRLNMDEGSGTTANDSAGTAQNGTITSPWWVAAGNPYSTKFNNALYFDGGARYVTMANHADLQLGASKASFTVSAWVNFPAGAAGTRFPIITKGTGSTLNYALWLEPLIGTSPAGHVSFVFHPDPTGCGAHSDIAVTDGAWHHVVGVYD
ncbi:MAG TPA: DUF4215 domain-containing protein, partial [bacterium]|nr:DUF4215 domain-containing protein [bacterium]